MTELPRGTVTLLFTDIEGSTRLLQELGAEEYVRALEHHRSVLRAAFAEHGGVEVEMQGDSFHYAFPTAGGAVAAAVAAQRALVAGEQDGQPIRVRMGMHTGQPLVTGSLYAGLDVHRAARVMSAGHGGQVLLSETTRAFVEEGLAPGLAIRDLGEHRLKDLSAPQRLYQLDIDGLQVEFPALAALHQTNLPVPATPFLGRERELAEVSALLTCSDVRLLTLTGPGGTGKTRLAAQAAGELTATYPHGVWWVSLAALRDPQLVLQTAEQALGAKQDLAAHIVDKSMLLLLDNFEQVVEAAVDIAGLLRSCPNLNLLVTSRAPLHVTGEHEYPVPPLVPQEAAGLFIARARAVTPDFSENGAVSEICRRLDHLPLAVELAAARVRVLSPESILSRLEQRLPLLTGGPRDMPERQRTLRSTIEWSYELLSPQERRLFARLAVFSGGCTLDSAEAVVDAELDRLESLIEKSLVRRSDNRFWMLETIREYAYELLDASAEANELRRRHAEHFAELAQRGYEAGTGPDSVATGERLSLELENFRTALRLSVQEPHPQLALRIAQGLFYLWRDRGLTREGLEWLAAADSVGGGEDPELRARVLGGAGGLAIARDDTEAARAFLDRALALTVDPARIASINMGLGLLEGGFVTGMERLERAAAFFRDSGDRASLVLALGNQAQVALAQEAYADAMALAREALGICSELEYENHTAWVTATLGEIELALGRQVEAAAHFMEALVLCVHHRDPAGVADSLESHGKLAVMRREHRRAAWIFGAVAAIRREYDVPRQRLDDAQLAPFLAELRREAQPGVVDEAWREGEAMSLDEAVAYALDAAA